MTLKTIYQQYLVNPTASALADRASLNYITTVVTVTGPAAIQKHLSAQAKQLKKKDERILSGVEGQSSLCLEVETTIEFVSSGGAYLPGLDDNFLADRVVTLPMVHIVQFDQSQKIEQIRIHWDQGSLLKQIDVIGSRAKNWPIRDGKDQARLIASSSALSTPATTLDILSPQSKKRVSTSATNDPHASLELFAPAEEGERKTYEATVAPRSMVRPPQRDLHDLLADNDYDGSLATPSAARSPSPTKKENIGHAQKAGAGKNFQPNRLFDEEPAQARTPEKGIKTYAKKFNHFDFAAPAVNYTSNSVTGKPKSSGQDSRPTSRHNNAVLAQWDFADFATPQKASTKIRAEDLRHLEWDNGDLESAKSPKWRATVHQPRRDADTHFAFNDQATPHAEKQPLGNITRAYNNQQHHKTFDSHFDMTDKSPSGEQGGDENGAAAGITENKAKAVKTMDANWGFFDRSSPEVARKAAVKTGGDGMGGKKGAGRMWGIGDESEDEAVAGGFGGDGRKGGKGKGTPRATLEDKGFWDF